MSRFLVRLAALSSVLLAVGLALVRISRWIVEVPAEQAPVGICDVGLLHLCPVARDAVGAHGDVLPDAGAGNKG